ncbi:hypothetical protein TIFTF001_045138, partial [Ficus carica]
MNAWNASACSTSHCLHHLAYVTLVTSSPKIPLPFKASMTGHEVPSGALWSCTWMATIIVEENSTSLNNIQLWKGIEGSDEPPAHLDSSWDYNVYMIPKGSLKLGVSSNGLLGNAIVDLYA